MLCSMTCMSDCAFDCGLFQSCFWKVCFPRVYYPGIASHISAELGLREDDDELVVLKLCNRSRAAGAFHNFEIMVCTFGCSTKD